MSARTINKFTCRGYGTLFLLLGVAILLLGGLLIHLSVFGVTEWSRILEVQAQALAGIDLKAFQEFGRLGGFLLVVAAVFIALGVLAFRQHVSAMIIGTVLYVFSWFPGALMSGFADLAMHRFELISTLVFALLTIVAIACRGASRSDRRGSQ